jgi:hypothetical protein
MKKALWETLLHSITWIVVEIAVQNFFYDSPARSAYAGICAWWATLYIGYVCGVGLKSVPLTAAAYLICYGPGFAMRVGLDSNTSLQGFLSFGVLLVFGALSFSSPIFLNSGVRFLVRGWVREL